MTTTIQTAEILEKNRLQAECHALQDFVRDLLRECPEISDEDLEKAVNAFLAQLK